MRPTFVSRAFFVWRRFYCNIYGAISSKRRILFNCECTLSMSVCSFRAHMMLRAGELPAPNMRWPLPPNLGVVQPSCANAQDVSRSQHALFMEVIHEAYSITASLSLVFVCRIQALNSFSVLSTRCLLTLMMAVLLHFGLVRLFRSPSPIASPIHSAACVQPCKRCSPQMV